MDHSSGLQASNKGIEWENLERNERAIEKCFFGTFNSDAYDVEKY